jgi:hypothetical protein
MQSRSQRADNELRAASSGVRVMRQPSQPELAAAIIVNAANPGNATPIVRKRLNELVTTTSPKRHTEVSMKFLVL